MFVDQREMGYFDKMRSSLMLLVSPIQYAVDWPIGIYNALATNISTKQNLIAENTKLQYQQLKLQAQMQKFIALEKENSQLRALLKSTPKISGRVKVAQLIAVDASPYKQLITIDRGSKDGVFVGQPVIDAYGVMGQIIHVGQHTSQVMLITDSKSAVPIQVTRTGERGIVKGEDTLSHLQLINMPKTANLRVGDILVTSGLGQRYPEAYPVGTVIHVNRIPGDNFLKVIVHPSAHINRTRLMLLIWPNRFSLLESANNETKGKKA